MTRPVTPMSRARPLPRPPRARRDGNGGCVIVDEERSLQCVKALDAERAPLAGREDGEVDLSGADEVRGIGGAPTGSEMVIMPPDSSGARAWRSRAACSAWRPGGPDREAQGDRPFASALVLCEERCRAGGGHHTGAEQRHQESSSCSHRRVSSPYCGVNEPTVGGAGCWHIGVATTIHRRPIVLARYAR